MKRFLPLAGRLVLAAAFAASAITKILDPTAFQEAVLGYDVVSFAVAAAVSAWLPWWEAAVAVALMVPTWVRSGAIHAIVLLLAFLTLIAVTLLRGLDPACGCFGSASGSLRVAAAVDLVLLVIAVALAAAVRQRSVPSPGSTGTASGP